MRLLLAKGQSIARKHCRLVKRPPYRLPLGSGTTLRRPLGVPAGGLGPSRFLIFTNDNFQMGILFRNIARGDLH